MNGLEDPLYMTQAPLLSPKRSRGNSGSIETTTSKRPKGINLQDVVDTLFSVQRSVVKLQQSVDMISERQARIEMSVAETRAMQTNMLRRVRNSRTREITQPLEELVRERAGGAASGTASEAAAVGEPPSACGVYFPSARGDAFTLTAQELAALQAFYGEGFEIQDSDTLRCRQDKFLRFACA